MSEEINHHAQGPVEFEEWPIETRSLLNLNPKEYKKHDLYAILGLAKLRYKATAEQIELAYKQKKERHGLDVNSEKTNNNNKFYECVCKAHEILSDPQQRCLYDSIDYGMTDSQIPKLDKDADFFKTYEAIFDHEARFSNRKDIPSIGDMESSEEHATKFYEFWYNFDSWRVYDYLDKEEVSENSEELRLISKNNRTNRAQKKKEDMMRVQSIIERMQATDPRTKRFKEEKKIEKEERRRAKEEALRLAEEKRIKEEAEELVRREQEEERKRQQAIEDKKLKERQKKVLKKERKALKTLIDDRLKPSEENEEVHGQELNLVFESMDLAETEAWKKELEGISAEETLTKILDKMLTVVIAGKVKAATLVHFKVEEPVVEPVEEVHQEPETKVCEWSTAELSMLIKAMKKYPVGTGNRWQIVADFVADHSKAVAHTEDEIIAKVAELKKGASLDEEEKARLQYSKKHSDDKYITEEPTINYAPIEVKKVKPTAPIKPKEVIPKLTPMAVKLIPKPTLMAVKLIPKSVNTPAPIAKSVPKKTEPTSTPPPASTLPTVTASVKSTPTVTTADPKPVVSKPTVIAEPATISPSIPTPVKEITETDKPTFEKEASASLPWTNEEQAMLEGAMKTYPPSWAGEGDRWDNIASMVDGRTKQECKRRVKALIEIIRAKKTPTSNK
ncbi:hypothetical protein BDF14DRAFT_1957190 [Spinellus fusiger]|nr:hypothetical protein BDF14DRAFT_1957190 [Spinellus fusiger]